MSPSRLSRNESSMLVALVGRVEQIEVNKVRRDADDAQVAQDKCKYVRKIDGANTRQNRRVQQQMCRPPCLHVHCMYMHNMVSYLLS